MVSLHRKAPKDLRMFCSYSFLVPLQRRREPFFSAFWYVRDGVTREMVAHVGKGHGRRHLWS